MSGAPTAFDRALAVLGIKEPFVRIAIADLMRDVELGDGLPAPGSPDEERLIEIGALVSKELGL